jgi:(R,R)-butanediol dehydrogenase/meso-butanediol dehydrogenase/diacetyl reductase
MGHEFCGRIKSVSSGSSKFKPGQAVMVDPHVGCRGCLSCTAGNDHVCRTLAFMGFSGGTLGGGLSEFVAVDEDHIYALPENVSLEYAAVIEPLVVGHHAAKMAAVDLTGADVLIVGGGPVGLAMVSVLRAHDVSKILLSEPTAKRWRHAKDAVDRVIDPKSEDVGTVCREATGNKGVDVVFDCAGVQPGLTAALDALKHTGTLVNVAMWEQPVRSEAVLDCVF